VRTRQPSSRRTFEPPFDALEDDEASGAASALAALAKGLAEKLAVSPTVKVAPASAAPSLPRRVGAPTLGVASKGQWRAAPQAELELVLLLSNIGGALETGVVIEVAGPALEASLVAPRLASGKSVAEASFEKIGSSARATLPDVRLPADLDVDRRADKKAARPPTTELTVSLLAAKAGSGLLTVRVIPAGRPDRSGSAMVGRTLVVEG